MWVFASSFCFFVDKLKILGFVSTCLIQQFLYLLLDRNVQNFQYMGLIVLPINSYAISTTRFEATLDYALGLLAFLLVVEVLDPNSTTSSSLCACECVG